MTRATLAIVAAFAAIFATAETNRTATENWTRNRIGEATNATLQAAKKYADAHGGDVQSVNGKTGTVVLAAADVHALPDTYTPPAAPVQSVNGKTGAVQLDYDDVGAWNGQYEVAAALELGYYGRRWLGGTPPYSLKWDSTAKRYKASWAVGDIPNREELAYLSDLDGIDGMTDNAAVLTNGALKTKSGTTITAANVGAISKGENTGASFSLTPSLMFLGGSYTTFSSTGISHGPRGASDSIEPDYLAWDWLKFTDYGLGTWINQNFIKQETDPTVDAKIAAAGHMTRTQADAAYYPKDQGQAWSTYWDGDDVRVTVTNYESVAHLPALYIEQRTNETAMATNLFRVVWREMAHWEKFLGSGWDWDGQWQGFKAWAAGIVAQIEEKADRAWGFFDSHTGQYAPDGYTSISSEHIMLCKGASYQKTVTTRGDVWVLTADEPYEPTGVSTNGGFQLKDGDGNVQFEIVKGDKVTVKAQANRVTVEDGTTLVVVYNVIAPEHPAGETCLALETAEWKKEDAADCPATVVWSGSSGNWVARITPKSGLATGRCFFKATYQRGGDTYINNKCAVGMSQIVLGGVTYNLGTATISGHTVLTLTPAN